MRVTRTFQEIGMEEEIRGKNIYDLELIGMKEEIICRTTEGFDERAWWRK
jgi:hypothetical protein